MRSLNVVSPLLFEVNIRKCSGHIRKLSYLRSNSPSVTYLGSKSAGAEKGSSHRPADPHLLPPSVEDWLPEPHPARFVAEMVKLARGFRDAPPLLRECDGGLLGKGRALVRGVALQRAGVNALRNRGKAEE